jgi:CheY-like chemotaxis protein
MPRPILIYRLCPVHDIMPLCQAQDTVHPRRLSARDDALACSVTSRMFSTAMDTSHPTRWSPPLQLPRDNATKRHGLLIAGDDRIVALCSSGPIADSWSVVPVTSLATAVARLHNLRSALVVTELHLADGDGVELCRAAKRASCAHVVLVVTDDVTRVPRALAAGCDSVLLKPFPPNLFFARLGRLRRGLHIVAVGTGVVQQAGTNQHWSLLPCSRCGHQGVTSFDWTSLHRAWYACPRCENVWIAGRQR